MPKLALQECVVEQKGNSSKSIVERFTSYKYSRWEFLGGAFFVSTVGYVLGRGLFDGLISAWKVGLALPAAFVIGMFLPMIVRHWVDKALGEDDEE